MLSWSDICVLQASWYGALDSFVWYSGLLVYLDFLYSAFGHELFVVKLVAVGRSISRCIYLVLHTNFVSSSREAV
jgi:hypothetical protein